MPIEAHNNSDVVPSEPLTKISRDAFEKKFLRLVYNQTQDFVLRRSTEIEIILGFMSASFVYAFLFGLESNNLIFFCFC